MTESRAAEVVDTRQDRCVAINSNVEGTMVDELGLYLARTENVGVCVPLLYLSIHALDAPF